jgi:hypothetical protein
MEDFIAKKTASADGKPVQGSRRLPQKRDEQEPLEAAEEAVSIDDQVDEDDMPGAVRVAGMNSTNDNGSSKLFSSSSSLKIENEESHPTAMLVSEQIIDEEEQNNIVKEAQRKVEETLKATVVQAQVQDIEEENKRKALRKKRVICTVVLVVLIAVGASIGAYFGTREPDADPAPAPIPYSPTSAPTPIPDLDLSNNICEAAFSIANVNATGILGSNTNSTTARVDTCEIIFENGIGSWYRMQGDDQRMMASTCQGTFFDSQISIFTGVCGRLQCVAGNDQMACGNGDQSRVAWFAEADAAYFIYVHGHREAEGLFTLAVGPMVENDECVTALSVEPFSDPFFGSTRGASVDTNVGRCGDARPTAPGVWYTFEGTGFRITAAVLTKDEDDLRITTAFRGQISVFKGSDCGNLECAIGKIGRQVNVESIEGETYFVLVNGQGILEGDFIISIGEQLDPRSPIPQNCLQARELLPGFSMPGSTRNQPIADFGSCGDLVFSTAPGVWYRTVGTKTGGVFQASTCNDTTSLDTQISVFVGTCEKLECLDGNDQGGECGNGSTLSWFTREGEDYFIFGM